LKIKQKNIKKQLSK